MIKSFRRSSNRKSSSSSNNHTSPTQTRNSSSSLKANADLHSPKKVIKALYDYEPQGPGELKFTKGDFFHVNRNENDPDWYEASNPVTGMTGMVPVPYFEVFQRSRPLSSTAAATPVMNGGNGRMNSIGSSPMSNRSSAASQSTISTLYAVVLYEFTAERADELDIIPGENLIICAHHDYEWFIAKPIDRLGGPGLVPVSYVQVIDLVSGTKSTDTVMGIVDKFKLPSIEQWKNKTAKYQASSIPLGTVTDEDEISLNNSSGRGSASIYVMDASVESFSLDNGRYRYLLKAFLSNGSVRMLYRYYQDFYDLQVTLLEDFPVEAGKTVGTKRTLPSIPGPLINVNDSISNLRRRELDNYIKILVNLPSNISKSQLVLNLFELRQSDREFPDHDEFLAYIHNENLPSRSSQRVSSNPVGQQSNYQQDRLSQYSVVLNKMGDLNVDGAVSTSNRSSPPNIRTVSGQSITPVAPEKKVKIKFFHEEDIFVLLVPTQVKLKDLKLKLAKRLDNEPDMIRLYLKNDYDEVMINNDGEPIEQDLIEYEIDDDERFASILNDKVKLIIVVDENVTLQ